MKISILLSTTDFRGDHEAEVRIAIEPLPDETVQHLAERILAERKQRETDVVEIRCMREVPQ